MNQPAFHEELAAHLDAQAHPKPHPPDVFMISVQDPFLAKLEAINRRMKDLDEMSARLRDFGLSDHPGPITMQEPGGWNWGLICVGMIYAAVIAISFALASGWRLK